MAWTRAELLCAQRDGRTIDVIADGLINCAILEVRENDVIVSTAFPGKAYVSFESVKSKPPKRFEPGTKVTTPYGSGVVAKLRISDDDISYAVKYVDKGATGLLLCFLLYFANMFLGIDCYQCWPTVIYFRRIFK